MPYVRGPLGARSGASLFGRVQTGNSRAKPLGIVAFNERSGFTQTSNINNDSQFSGARSSTPEVHVESFVEAMDSRHMGGAGRAGTDDSDAEWLADIQLQGGRMADEVARLRQMAFDKTVTLQTIQAEKEAEGLAAAEVRQMLEEVEEEMRYLREEAARATYLQQQYELQQLVIEDLRALRSTETASTNDARLAELEEALEMALDAVESGSSDVAALEERERELAELRQRVTSGDEQLAQLTQSLDDMKREYNKVQTVAERAKSEARQSDAKVAKLLNEFTALEKSFNEFRRTKSRGKNFKGFDPARQQLEVAKYLQQIDAYERQVREGHAELLEARKARDEAVDEQMRQEAALRAEITKLNQVLSSREAEAAAQLERLRAELQLVEDAGGLENLKAAQQEAEQLKRELREREDNIKALTLASDRVHKELQEKSAQLEEAKRISNELRAELQQKAEQLARTKKDLDESEAEREQQVQVISGMKTDLRNAAMALRSKDEEIEALHGKVLTVRSQTLKLEESLRQARDEDHKMERIGELEAALRDAQDQYSDARSELTQMQRSLEQATQRERAMSNELNHLRNTLNAGRDSEARLAQELNAVREQLDDVTRTLADREARLSGMEKQLDDSALGMQQRELEVRSLRSEVARLKQREASWSAELQDAAQQSAELNEQLQRLEDALVQKDRQLRGAQEDAAQAQSAADELMANVQELMNSNEQSEAMLEQLQHVQESLSKKDRQLEVFSRERDQLATEVKKLRSALSSEAAAKEAAARDLATEQSLREQLAAENANTAELLRQAEAFARALQEQLNENSTGGATTSDDSVEVATLQAALKKQQTALEAAERDAASLRRQLQGLQAEAGDSGRRRGGARPPPPGTSDTSNLLNRTRALMEESERKQAENDALREAVRRLEQQLAERQQGTSATMGDEELKSKVQEIEEENARLKNKALRTGRILAQSRKFMDMYLTKSQKMLRTARLADGDLEDPDAANAADPARNGANGARRGGMY